MKMVTAIIDKKFSNNLCRILNEESISFTKISTVGGFLKSGNVTLMIGIEDEKLEYVLNIIRTNNSRRKEIMPIMPMTEGNNMMVDNHPLEIDVGGATIFVTPVEHFEKV